MMKTNMKNQEKIQTVHNNSVLVIKANLLIADDINLLKYKELMFHVEHINLNINTLNNIIKVRFHYNHKWNNAEVPSYITNHEQANTWAANQTKVNNYNNFWVIG